MGNYRFKLSDMVPNAWFYKLNDKGKSRSQSRNQIKKKQTSSSSLSSNLSSSLFSSSSNSNLQQTKTQQHHNLSYQRKSYYFSRNLSPYNSQQYSKHPTSNNIINISESPTKSANKRRSTSRRKTSISPKCVNSPFSSSFTTSSSEPESSVHSHKTFDAMIMSAPRRRCNDIVTDMSKNDHIFDSISKMDLPPITTKPKKLQDSTNIGTSPKRRVSMSSSIGVKLRTKSPRIVSRKSVSSIRTSVGEKSFVVVKSSKDPHKDFKESMVEMIVKNNIRTSKDLEDLLACYLSLNSDHYHNLIIKVFKQIWFEIQLR